MRCELNCLHVGTWSVQFTSVVLTTDLGCQRKRKQTRVASAVQGDWGTQFGMLIQHMSELRPGGLADVGEEDISDLLILYKCVLLKLHDDLTSASDADLQAMRPLL